MLHFEHYILRYYQTSVFKQSICVKWMHPKYAAWSLCAGVKLKDFLRDNQPLSAFLDNNMSFPRAIEEIVEADISLERVTGEDEIVCKWNNTEYALILFFPFQTSNGYYICGYNMCGSYASLHKGLKNSIKCFSPLFQFIRLFCIRLILYAKSVCGASSGLMFLCPAIFMFLCPAIFMPRCWWEGLGCAWGIYAMGPPWKALWTGWTATCLCWPEASSASPGISGPASRRSASYPFLSFWSPYRWAHAMLQIKFQHPPSQRPHNAILYLILPSNTRDINPSCKINHLIKLTTIALL